MLKKLATILCAAAFGLAVYAPDATACPGSDMESHKVAKKDKKKDDKKVAKKDKKSKEKAKDKSKAKQDKSKAKKGKKVTRR